MRVIIQPSTYERNLGGICYMPYWVYSFYRSGNIPVEIHEDVTVREMDSILQSYNKSDFFIIDLSSYPQIDLALIFYKELCKKQYLCQFVGYKPLIEKYNLPYITENVDLLKGCFNSIFYLEETKFGLLSDCDNHLKQIGETKKVVPLFLSVGCKRACPFCYCTGTNYPYGFMDKEQIKKVIDYCESKKYNIHFCDENFYYHDEIEFIIEYLKTKHIKYIALTDSLILSHIVEGKFYFTEKDLLESGNILNEIGLEVVEESALKKAQNIKPLLNSKLKLFWLTMTFLPDDTIKNQNKTGQFLKKYGYKYDELLERIRTNSTVGGLGQFYQIYDGLKGSESCRKSGVELTERATRLSPSYIGDTYLSEIPKRNSHINEEDFKWFELYGINEGQVTEVFYSIDGKENVRRISKMQPDNLIIIAILARLNIITTV